MSFERNFGDKNLIKYDKNLMDTAAKTVIEDGKAASKRVVQKTAEAKDLIENKIADKITSVGKTKSKEKKIKDK